MADFFTWDASRSLQWVRETRWGDGATPDDAIEAVADEEAARRFKAHRPDSADFIDSVDLGE